MFRYFSVILISHPNFLRDFHANEEEFRAEFKVPPFQDCILSFLGFSEEEKANMEERTLKHGLCLRTNILKPMLLLTDGSAAVGNNCKVYDGLGFTTKLYLHNYDFN